MPVSDKTAIITGAGSRRGIGRATAHAMAAGAGTSPYSTWTRPVRRIPRTRLPSATG